MPIRIQYRDRNGGYTDVPVGRLYVLKSPNALQLRAVSTSANPNYALCNWSSGVQGQTANVNVNANSTADTDAAATTVTATLGNESATVRMTVYSVTETVTPVRNSPAQRTNPISLGVAERVNLGFTTTPAGLSAAAVGGLRWRLVGLAQYNRQGVLKAAATGNALPNASGTAYYTAPNSTDDSHESIPAIKTKTVQLNLVVDSGPSAGQVAVQKNIVVHTPAAVMVARANEGIHKQNNISAGFLGDVYLTPDSVNFEALEFREAGGSWTVHTGTFSQAHLTDTGGPNVHQATTVGTHGIPISIVNNRNHVGDMNTYDEVYSFGELAFAPANHVGQGTWRIYWQYRVANTTTWIRFQIADHDARSDAAGRCTQSKAGATITYALAAPTTARATALGL